MRATLLRPDLLFPAAGDVGDGDDGGGDDSGGGEDDSGGGGGDGEAAAIAAAPLSGAATGIGPLDCMQTSDYVAAPGGAGPGLGVEGVQEGLAAVAAWDGYLLYDAGAPPTQQTASKAGRELHGLPSQTEEAAEGAGVVNCRHLEDMYRNPVYQVRTPRARSQAYKRVHVLSRTFQKNVYTRKLSRPSRLLKAMEAML